MLVFSEPYFDNLGPYPVFWPQIWTGKPFNLKKYIKWASQTMSVLKNTLLKITQSAFKLMEELRLNMKTGKTKYLKKKKKMLLNVK